MGERAAAGNEVGKTRSVSRLTADQRIRVKLLLSKLAEKPNSAD